jgi:hypothetical protein
MVAWRSIFLRFYCLRGVSLEQKLLSMLTLSTFYVKLGVLLNMYALNSLQSSLVVEDKRDHLCRVSSPDSRSR